MHLHFYSCPEKLTVLSNGRNLHRAFCIGGRFLLCETRSKSQKTPPVGRSGAFFFPARILFSTIRRFTAD